MDKQTSIFNSLDEINSPKALRRSGLRFLSQKYLRAMIIVTFDFLGLAAAIYAAERFLIQEITLGFLGLIIIFIPFCVIQYLLGQYFSRRSHWRTVGTTWNTIGLMLVFSSTAYLVNPEGAKISVLIWILAGFSISVASIVARQLMRLIGIWHRNVIILGVGTAAQQVAHNLLTSPSLGYRVRFFIDVANTSKTKNNEADTQSFDAVFTEQDVSSSIEIVGRHIPVVQNLGSLNSLLARLGAPRVIIALDEEAQTATAAKLIRRLEFSPCDLSLVPPKSQLGSVGVEVETVGKDSIILMKIRNNSQRFINRALKRIFDFCASGIGLVALSPFFLLLAITVRTTGRSVIFGHSRVGKKGRIFKCYKFRSMVENSQEILTQLLETDEASRKEWSTHFKLKDDPRITRIGAFLRKTSLDELPQLYNVLKGEMSLVGPRPITPEELALYGEYQSFYLASRPGCTGLWQVNGRSDTSYAERVDMDIWYAKNWSLWKDIEIIFGTLSVMVSKEGAY